MLVVRIRRSHLKAIVFAVLLIAGGFGVGSALANHDPDTIHACASRSNGSLRIVNSASDCRSNETPLEWSTEGSISIPQACPAGQFVTGIDENGQLTCAAPGGTGGGGTGGGGTNVCGDGVKSATEGCDDGNTVSGDGCSATCGLEVCGNGVVNQGETCDTGGNSQTCDADCTAAACGDGTVNPQSGEQCDAGGPSSFCTATCQVSVCGDAILNPLAGEQCDDGDNVSGDGCSAACTIEPN